MNSLPSVSEITKVETALETYRAAEAGERIGSRIVQTHAIAGIDLDVLGGGLRECRSTVAKSAAR